MAVSISVISKGILCGCWAWKFEGVFRTDSYFSQKFQVRSCKDATSEKLASSTMAGVGMGMGAGGGVGKVKWSW